MSTEPQTEIDEDIELSKLTLLCMRYLESGLIPSQFSLNSALECHNYIIQKSEYLKNWQKKLNLNEYTSSIFNIENILDQIVLEVDTCSFSAAEMYISETLIKLGFLEIALDKIIKNYENI